MKLYRTELDKGIHKKLFDIDADQFHSDDLDFYKESISGEMSIEKKYRGISHSRCISYSIQIEM